MHAAEMDQSAAVQRPATQYTLLFSISDSWLQESFVRKQTRADVPSNTGWACY